MRRASGSHRSEPVVRARTRTPTVERPLAGLLTSNRESEQGPARYSEMILYVRRLSDEEEGAE